MQSTTNSGRENPDEIVKKLDSCYVDFSSAMNDDFNTREALAVLFQFSRLLNKCKLDSFSRDLQSKLIELFAKLGGEVLGLFTKKELDSDFEAKVQGLIEQRNEARFNKEWSKSDSIRDKLTSLGVEIQDTSDGTTWNLI